MIEGLVMYDFFFVDFKFLMVLLCEWDEVFEGKFFVFSLWIKLVFLCIDFMF